MSQYVFLQTFLNNLVVDGGAATPGTVVTMQPQKAGSANQLWRFTEDGFIEHKQSGLVLDISGNNTTPGTSVILWTKKPTDNNNQKWTLLSDGHIVSQLNNRLFLDIRGENSNAGADLIVWTQNVPTSNNQLWRPLADLTSTNNTTFLQTLLNGFVADGGAGTPGTVVTMTPQATSNVNNQTWTFTNEGFIVHDKTGLVLDVKGASTAPATSVILWPMKPTDNNNQRWRFANGYLYSLLGNLVLDIRGSNGKIGADLIIYPPNNPVSNNQLWRPLAKV